ncbi:hypothetical protein SLS60_005015 [Paraconiothyrium brasiliense]|uniref:Ankyrin repeat protein n=1 Tax=Paraconiothyrium brasiliense TaxID=300254 RepID=A0ABR3RG62_9PLEO
MACSVEPASPSIQEQLSLAVKAGDKATVDQILALSPCPDLHNNHRTATLLHSASALGDEDIFKDLLGHGAPLNGLDQEGRTPLHVAAMKGPLAIVRHLIEAIPENGRAEYINLGSKDLASAGMTALHAACYPTSPEGCVKFLLANGADRDAVWDRGRVCGPRRWTAAHCACYYTQLDAMKLLLEPESDIFGVLLQDGPRETPRTCLQRACWSNNVECVEWLLKNMKFENIQKPDGKGWSAWDCASFGVQNVRERARDRSPLMALVELAVKEKAEDFNSWCRWEERRRGQRTFGIWECILSNTPSFIGIRSWRDPEMTALTATLGYQNGLKYCRGVSSLRQYYPSLTLDEYCCQALSKDALTRRNYDQVILSLQFPETYASESKQDALDWDAASKKLIVVQQAWIWKVQDVLLCSGAYLGYGFESEIAPDAKDVLKGIGVMLVYLIRKADIKHDLSTARDSNDHWDHFAGNIFEIFEQAIAAVSESVDTYLRVVNMDAINLATEKSCLHRIIDIQEELSMIKRIIHQQEEVWQSFASKAWPDYWQDGRFRIPQEDWNKCSQEEKQEWETVMSPETIFKAYYRRIAQLDEDAQRVERSVTLMLDLKSKHATMSEAHTSAIMSAAVVGFTIVTIIFAPMSYMATLFALPLNTFQEKQDPSRFSSESGAYRSSYFAKWTVTATFTTILFTVLCMWLAIKALKVSIVRPALRDLRDLATKFAEDIMDFWWWTRLKRQLVTNGHI